MKTNRFFFAAAAFAATIAAGTAHAQATINQSKIQSWPHVLSQPGHYKLTGNIVVPAGMAGFKITAPNVTFDLNGFTIAGPVTCSLGGMDCSVLSGGAHGLELAADHAVVRGGTIRGFASYGVAMTGSGGGFRLTDMTVTQNSGGGIVFSGTTAGLIDRVHVASNGNTGMKCWNGTVTNSAIEFNGGSGISANGCTIVDSIIRGNKGTGVNSSSALLRGNRLLSNGTNKSGTIHSGGGNLDGSTLF